jgi:hypothetical protein
MENEKYNPISDEYHFQLEEFMLALEDFLKAISLRKDQMEEAIAAEAGKTTKDEVTETNNQ